MDEPKSNLFKFRRQDKMTTEPVRCLAAAACFRDTRIETLNNQELRLGSSDEFPSRATLLPESVQNANDFGFESSGNHSRLASLRGVDRCKMIDQLGSFSLVKSLWHNIRLGLFRPDNRAMSEHRKQARFLKTLVMYDDNPAHRSLCDRLAAAERNERCLLCACRLVGLIALLGLAGIGYSAVLLPEFFDNATHIVIRFFSALGLGSTLCFTLFLGLWFYYRTGTNRVHEECRRVITVMLEARLKTTTTTFYPVLVDDPNLKVKPAQPLTDGKSRGAELARLTKAS